MEMRAAPGRLEEDWLEARDTREDDRGFKPGLGGRAPGWRYG